MSYEEQKAQEQIDAGVYHEEQKNNKKLKLGGLPVCLYNKLEQCPTPYICESCDDKPPVT